MVLPTSGALSLNAMHVEAGGSSGTSASINDSDIRSLISKGSGVQMSFSEWYGASAGYSLNEHGYAVRFIQGSGGLIDSRGLTMTTNSSGNSRAWHFQNQDGGSSVYVNDTTSNSNPTKVFANTLTTHFLVAANYDQCLLAYRRDQTYYGFVSINASGSVVWRKRFNTNQYQYEGFTGGPQGNPCAAGITIDGGFITTYKDTNHQKYIVKINNNSSIAWAYSIGSTATTYSQVRLYPYDSNNIQLVVRFSNTTTCYNMLINKSTGAMSSQKVWTSGTGHSANSATYVRNKFGAGLFQVRGSNASAIGAKHSNNSIYSGHYSTHTGSTVNHADNWTVLESGRFVFSNRYANNIFKETGVARGDGLVVFQDSGTWAVEWAKNLSSCTNISNLDGYARKAVYTYQPFFGGGTSADNVFYQVQGAGKGAGSTTNTVHQIYEFDGANAPTNGTYDSHKAFFIANKPSTTTGFEGHSVTGGAGGNPSTQTGVFNPNTSGQTANGWYTSMLGSSNPTSSSAISYTSTSPTLTNTTDPGGSSNANMNYHTTYTYNSNTYHQGSILSSESDSGW